MRIAQFMNAADAAAIIKDGDTVAISGNGAGMISAEAVFAALEQRFMQTGHPRDLTLVHSLGLGDRGALGTNRFAHEGMVRKVVLSKALTTAACSMIGCLAPRATPTPSCPRSNSSITIAGAELTLPSSAWGKLTPRAT